MKYEIINKTNEDARILSVALQNSSEEYLFNKELEIEFKIDTFLIQQVLFRSIEVDFSTAGMLNATYSAMDS